MPYSIPWWRVFLYRARHLRVLRRVNVVRRWKAYRRKVKARAEGKRADAPNRTQRARTVRTDSCAPLLSRQQLQSCAKIETAQKWQTVKDTCRDGVSPNGIYVPDPPRSTSKSSSFRKPSPHSSPPPSLLLSSSSTFLSVQDMDPAVSQSLKVPPKIRTKPQPKQPSRPQTAGSDARSSERESSSTKAPTSQIDLNEGAPSLQVLQLHAERQKLAKLKVPDSMMSARSKVSPPKDDNGMALLERLVTMKRKQMMQRLKEMDGDDAVDDSSSETASPSAQGTTQSHAPDAPHVPSPPVITPPLTQPLLSAPLTPPPGHSSNSATLQRLLDSTNDVEQQLDQLEKQAKVLTQSSHTMYECPQTASTDRSSFKGRSSNDTQPALNSQLSSTTRYSGVRLSVKRSAEDCTPTLSQSSSLSGTISGALSGELSRPQTAQTDISGSARLPTGLGVLGGDHHNPTALLHVPAARNVRNLDSEFLLSPSTAGQKDSPLLDSAQFLSPTQTAHFGSRSMSSGTFVSLSAGDTARTGTMGSGGFLSPLTFTQPASRGSAAGITQPHYSPTSRTGFEPPPAESTTLVPRLNIAQTGPQSDQSEALTGSIDRAHSTARSSATSFGVHSHLAADFPRGVELVEDMEAARTALRKMAHSSELEHGLSDAGFIQPGPHHVDAWRVPAGLAAAPRGTMDGVPCCAASALLCDLDSASKAVARLHALRQQQAQLSRMMKRGDDLRRSLQGMDSVAAEVARLERLNQEMVELLVRLPAAEREHQELCAKASHLSELESELPGLRSKAASVELLRGERYKLAEGVARAAPGAAGNASSESDGTVSWGMMKAMVDRLEEVEGQNQVLVARNQALEGRNTFLEMRTHVLQRENQELQLRLKELELSLRSSRPNLSSQASLSVKPVIPAMWPRSLTPNNSMAETSTHVISPTNSLAGAVQPICSTPDIHTTQRTLAHQSG